MAEDFDLTRFIAGRGRTAQYPLQLARLHQEGKETACLESAVDDAISNLSSQSRSSFVIYGEPQSGKTEMMICLTARLLDEGRRFILHLLNDSVDLLGQNLGRFQKSGLAPAAKNYTDILDPSFPIRGRSHVVFCKKNARDLSKLIQKLGQLEDLVIIDDEADYASPNSKVNSGAQTRINELIAFLLGDRGDYIGVTATPARLDLNNTFENDSSLWVNFRPHALYTGQDVFFPIEGSTPPPYRLSLLPNTSDTPRYARRAFFGFLLNVADLNGDGAEQNYSMLIHTSGKRADHKADWDIFDRTVSALIDPSHADYGRHVKELWELARSRFGAERADDLTDYVLGNISRYAIFVLNSDRDFVQNGLSATNPSALFTIIIGGNIVSRGVTFENLLSMFFTRDVRHKMQQDTYIQRARMFGSRGRYLRRFELTIPEHLYLDWHRCFVFHRLALTAIQRNLGSPVWLTDHRIAAVAASSIDRSTVDIDRGEMAFRLFDFDERYDDIVASSATIAEKLSAVSETYGDASLPRYLRDFILRVSDDPATIALHPAGSVDGYSDGEPGLDKSRIERRKGFMGRSQLEKSKYPKAVHHIKVFTNAQGKGRVFYKFEGSIQFVKNVRR